MKRWASEILLQYQCTSAFFNTNDGPAGVPCATSDGKIGVVWSLILRSHCSR